MLRIAHVITALETGGAQHQLERMIECVPGEHCVFSLRGPDVVEQRLRQSGIAVHTLNVAGARGLAVALCRLRSGLRDFRPDVVQGWLYHGNIAASLAVWPRKTPVIWNTRHSVHDLAAEPRNTRRAIRASVHLARHPRAIVYNSRTAADQHERLGYPADRREVIPNGFDLSALRPDAALGRAFRERAGVPVSAPVVGVVARYHPMKDHAGFLQAAARLKRVMPEARFLLAGRDVDARNRTLAAAIAQAGLESSVHLLGECDDIPALCNALDVLCCPSAWGEGFPNAVGEAMACGVPCVVTDVGDSALLVGDSGHAVAIRDPSAVADALQCLLTDDAHRAACGRAARQRMVEQYAVSGVAEAYESLWRRVAGDAERIAPQPGTHG